jgi:hypothetical protein
MLIALTVGCTDVTIPEVGRSRIYGLKADGTPCTNTYPTDVIEGWSFEGQATSPGLSQERRHHGCLTQPRRIDSTVDSVPPRFAAPRLRREHFVALPRAHGGRWLPSVESADIGV